MAATREVRTDSLGQLNVGDIWANRQDGVFVVVSARPARWHGEDRDVYGHIDTWYTIRDADATEIALWDTAVIAAAARKRLRAGLGASSSHQYSSGRLVSTMRKLDSYDDRWEPPADIILDDEAVAIEDGYIAAVAALHGHTSQ